MYQVVGQVGPFQVPALRVHLAQRKRIHLAVGVLDYHPQEHQRIVAGRIHPHLDSLRACGYRGCLYRVLHLQVFHDLRQLPLREVAPVPRVETLRIHRKVGERRPGSTRSHVSAASQSGRSRLDPIRSHIGFFQRAVPPAHVWRKAVQANVGPGVVADSFFVAAVQRGPYRSRQYPYASRKDQQEHKP